MSRLLPPIHRPGAGGGSGPVAGEDLFAPKILVGNELNGDSVASAPFPFRYIRDPGDGTGIATALTELAVAGQGGDLYIRPGVYDFGAAGSPALPLAVPANVRIHGAGEGWPVAQGGDPTRGTTLLASDSTRSLLTLGAFCSMDHLAVHVGTPAAGAAGTVLIDATGEGPVRLGQVAVVITAGPNDVVNESLQALVRGPSVELHECFVGPRDLAVTYRPGAGGGADLVGVEIANPLALAAARARLTSTTVRGMDVGVEQSSSELAIGSCDVNAVVVGVDALNGAGFLSMTNTALTDIVGRGLRVDSGTRAYGTNLRIAAAAGLAGTGHLGIELTRAGTRLRVGGVDVTGFDQALLSTLSTEVNIDRGFVLCTNQPGVWAVELNDGLPHLANFTIALADGGIDINIGADSGHFTGLSLINCTNGVRVRAGATDQQITNVRCNTGVATGIALDVQAGADGCLVTNFSADGYATGVSYAADRFTYVGGDLTACTAAFLVVGAPATPEIAHVQV